METFAQKLPLSFFEKISSTEYGKWNPNKTEFKTINMPDEATIKQIEYLRGLGLFCEIKIVEDVHLLIKQDLKKLKILSSLIHDKYIKYNSTLSFIKKLVSIIQGQDSNGKIDIESIIDYLGIEDSNYIFFDIELLVHSLAIYKNEYIAKWLMLLLEELDEENKNELILAIDSDCSFFYYEDSKIKEIKTIYNSQDESGRIFWKNHLEEIGDTTIFPIISDESNQEGNIFYYNRNYINGSVNIIYISECVIYDRLKYLFINKENKKEFNISMHGNYDVMMDVLIKNRGEYVVCSKFSGMDVFQQKDSRDDNKRLTDTKNNLLNLLRKNLDIEDELNFIEVNNGFKLA